MQFWAGKSQSQASQTALIWKFRVIGSGAPLEAQFANSGISQDATKYNIVVAALDENVLDFVVDILSDPPENEKYNTLKKALLNRLTDTEESRLKKLLTDLELGDKRPSDLLREMKSLAGNSISDEVIKSLWLQRLPQQTQAILTISNDTIDKIAEMADKIIAVYSSSEICQVTKVGSLPNSASSSDRNKLDYVSDIHHTPDEAGIQVGQYARYDFMFHEAFIENLHYVGDSFQRNTFKSCF
ncbi:uncharacterized protein NPIL_677541 [Nephila pilipes]|uniref:DUF7041 domain-containing protein n=1 Tax=Nephila pilipes TaxID=299642 RepID=A0A8X6U1J4_NEPPI|nr:uncharacterized protein NPIL_677541 [Nephila pilipes]